VRIVALVQARMGSTRFPDKVLQPIGGVPMLALLLRRLSGSARLDAIAVATTTAAADTPLADVVRGLGFGVFRGSEQDVLDRFARAAEALAADVVVRITGDCPLVDPAVVDHVVDGFLAAGVAYFSNIAPPTYPDGLDVEVFAAAALARAAAEATAPRDREHVTPFLRESGLFSVGRTAHDPDWSHERWTVDEPADLEVVAGVFEAFHPRVDFGWTEVLALRASRPEIFEANRHIGRDEGARIGTGQKLWKRARRVIPGGSMLLSKRAEMFLPGGWPAYFSRAAGCTVWDLDGTPFTDMSLMGVGTNTLGYGHPDVDAAVTRAIGAGNLSTLNCPEEVRLAERLVGLHPWADMARFARSGGEANAIAIRIARAATGRDTVAICGYHGWHDWYLAANLGDHANLAGHLLPGLEPRGVPQELRGSVQPFRFNDLAALEAIAARHDLAAIQMEVSRGQEPAPGYLEAIRRLATDRGIVLIFDECTSGFRQTFGGLHLQFGVEPDMAVFGKTLGNGYAITAVIGRRDVMEAAQTTFISSTFWTERIGPAAALAALDTMERLRSWEVITAAGRSVRAGWRDLATRHGLPIAVSGLPALAAFSFPGPAALAYKTLLTQEMLAKGYLATTALYSCIDHRPEVIAAYLEALDGVFEVVKACEDGRADVGALLAGPVCHSGFARLT
jgi:glutamate-1-semialdehyde 2,1-aminomutase